MRLLKKPYRTRLLLAVAFVCLVFAVPTLSGCRMSDALTEVIYDQTSKNIDYNNPDKYLLNDSTAETKDERVPAQESDKTGRVTEEKQNIVVYSSNPNMPEFTAKKSVWSKDPDFPGLEASEKVHFYISDDPDATEQDIETPPIEEPQQEEEDTTTQESSNVGSNTDTGTGGTGDSTNKGKKKSSKGKSTTPEQTSTGGGSGGDEWVDAPDLGGTPEDGTSNKGTYDNVGDDPAPMVDASGDFAELPTVDKIAAVGQAAVIVQMIGGEGALAAADQELLNSEFSSVFADEGASSIVAAWSDDGSPGGVDMDKIESSGAQLIIVDTPNFTESLSQEQSKKLNVLLAKGAKGEDGGVQDIIYADLSNTANIKSLVKKVGSSLKDSTSIGQAGKTESNAAAYIEFHDNLVKECAGKNGGLAYDAMTNTDPIVYELGGNTGSLSTGDQLGFNGNATFTLLLDEWDSSVRYIGGDWNPNMSGIALSYTGYANSPVSYYLQAAGLVNNAAARGNASDPGLYPVWQFSSILPMLKKSSLVEYSAGGAFDTSSTPTKNRGGSSWDSVLLTTSYNPSQQGAIAGSSFGSSLFPKLIAATQSIAREMKANSDGAQDAYHPFEAQTDDVRGMRGYVTETGDIIFSCIGSPGASGGAERTIGDAITDDDIVVNPHGLFTSWTEYGSVEGVLEAAWANDVVNGTSDTVGWESYVLNFYETFYRYDCSADISTITNGLAG